MNGCTLERKLGDLPFDFYGGMCGTFNFTSEIVLMCFADSNKKFCWT